MQLKSHHSLIENDNVHEHVVCIPGTHWYLQSPAVAIASLIVLHCLTLWQKVHTECLVTSITSWSPLLHCYTTIHLNNHHLGFLTIDQTHKDGRHLIWQGRWNMHYINYLFIYDSMLFVFQHLPAVQCYLCTLLFYQGDTNEIDYQPAQERDLSWLFGGFPTLEHIDLPEKTRLRIAVCHGPMVGYLLKSCMSEDKIGWLWILFGFSSVSSDRLCEWFALGKTFKIFKHEAIFSVIWLLESFDFEHSFVDCNAYQILPPWSNNASSLFGSEPHASLDITEWGFDH